MAELADLKAQLSDLYTSVLTDMIEPKTGAVLAQITNAQIRITEVELKVREQQELEVRLEELEEVLESKKGSNQWGA
jgi:CRISPR/Cas system-associated exonuclease Cas4 (RecB family)